MATVNKNFKIKQGLVVEGTTGTIDGNNILTETASDQYIIDLIGGETLVTSVNASQLEVVEGELSVKSGVFDDSGAADTAYSNAQTYASSVASSYADTAYSNAVSYADGLASNYDAAGSAEAVGNSLSSHESDTTTHGVTGDIVGTSDEQTLSNKTIDGALDLGTSGSFIQGSSGNTTVYSTDTLYLTSNGGDIVLNADGHSYIGSATAGNEVATHSYVDNAVSGLAWKQAVNLKVTSTIDITGDQVGAVFDGHAALTTADAGYRFLVTDQGTSSENGIWESYVDGSTLLLRRPADADAYTELIGAAVYIMEGTQYGSTSWVQGNHYLTNFSGQDWAQFSGQGSVTAGTGIVVDGLEVSVDFTVVAEVQDLTDGLANKQDNLTAGNGIDISGNTISVAFDAGNGLAINGTNLTVDTNVIATQTYASSVASSALDSAESYASSVAYVAYSNALSEANSYTDSAISGIDLSTDDVTEGSHLYFTDQRAVDAITNATIYPTMVEINDYRKEEAARISIASAGTANLHSFSYPYESVKYLVRVVGWSGGVKHSQITEILMTVDGNDNIAMTEYGTICTDSTNLASFSATYNSGSDEYVLTATTVVDSCELVAAATLLSWAD